MHIVLIILKIIGIVLLCILGFLFLLLLAILFVPVRYEAKGSFIEKKPYLSARISYAFPLVWFRFVFDQNKQGYIRLLGIKIYDLFATKKKKKKNLAKRRKQNNTKNKPQNNAEDENKKQLEVDSIEDTIDKKSDKETAAEVKVDSEMILDENANSDKELDADSITEEIDDVASNSLAQRFLDFYKHVIELFSSIKIKISNLKNKWINTKEDITKKRDTILEYIAFFEQESTKQAFCVAKKTIIKLLKSIRPKKYNFILRIGTGDPASTGQICGFYGMLYPFLENHVIIYPDFENSIYEGEFIVKGRIYFFQLVKAGLIFLLHKDLKPIRNMILN